MSPVAMASPNDILRTTPESDAHGQALDSVFFRLAKDAADAAAFVPELEAGLRKVRDFIERGVPCTKKNVLCNRALLQFSSTSNWVKPRIGDRYREVMRELLGAYIGAGLIHINAPFTLQVTGATSTVRMPLERAIRRHLEVAVAFIEFGADETLVPYCSDPAAGVDRPDILSYVRSELHTISKRDFIAEMEAAIKQALMQRRIREVAADECKSRGEFGAAPAPTPAPTRRRKAL